jgi:hypothetical protein
LDAVEMQGKVEQVIAVRRVPEGNELYTFGFLPRNVVKRDTDKLIETFAQIIQR